MPDVHVGQRGRVEHSGQRDERQSPAVRGQAADHQGGQHGGAPARGHHEAHHSHTKRATYVRLQNKPIVFTI